LEGGEKKGWEVKSFAMLWFGEEMASQIFPYGNKEKEGLKENIGAGLFGDLCS